MTVETLATDTHVIESCPAFVVDDEGLPIECGARLRVVLTADLIGDDYGSWRTYSVAFECGHTVADMESGIRHAGEI